MKKQFLLLCLSLLVIFFSFLSACGIKDPTQSIFPTDTLDGEASDNTPTDYKAAIRELENRIIELQQTQYISDAEYEKELSSLLSQLEALRAESEAEESEREDDTSEGDDMESVSRFLYTVTDGLATITGYTGNEAHVVIPSVIDGYPVETVGEGALSSEKIRSIVISNGVRRIDWFAFSACTALREVTVPESVHTIGYDAFGTRDATFTLYCHSGSFAQSYAKSYGISYAAI